MLKSYRTMHLHREIKANTFCFAYLQVESGITFLVDVGAPLHTVDSLVEQHWFYAREGKLLACLQSNAVYITAKSSIRKQEFDSIKAQANTHSTQSIWRLSVSKTSVGQSKQK